eukprot:NODE_3893_length_867_cov_2.979218_g3231_i0.p1 GENE.NODE_3893_length_867_cov_2.979218_g3231_i0~~NODE_3893_length_867_cov_2.979218_g3231_i0.p1  ORF type:complete len:139 (+),score=13.18 NODE_3893_length_867_cov_2.979218_g3231_i0:274-690(+)
MLLTCSLSCTFLITNLHVLVGLYVLCKGKLLMNQWFTGFNGCQPRGCRLLLDFSGRQDNVRRLSFLMHCSASSGLELLAALPASPPQQTDSAERPAKKANFFDVLQQLVNIIPWIFLDRIYSPFVLLKGQVSSRHSHH